MTNPSSNNNDGSGMGRAKAPQPPKETFIEFLQSWINRYSYEHTAMSQAEFASFLISYRDFLEESEDTSSPTTGRLG